MKTTWKLGFITVHSMEPICKRTAQARVKRVFPPLITFWRTA